MILITCCSTCAITMFGGPAIVFISGPDALSGLPAEWVLTTSETDQFAGLDL